MANSHTLVLGLFEHDTAAAVAARALRDLGLPRERVSIVARSHAVEGDLAAQSGASPGSEIEDSLPASRAGELGGYLIAAVAMILPGIGPIVAAGPLAADLGEAAGHLAGGVARMLEKAGLDQARAEHWESQVGGGAVLVGAHVGDDHVDDVRASLTLHGATDQSALDWPGDID
ncbi:MAG: hypothetical protein ABL986_04025 [Vicinamibacterales bacterium]